MYKPILSVCQYHSYKVRLCVGLILKLNQLALCVCVCKWVEYQNLNVCGVFFVCFKFFFLL